MANAKQTFGAIPFRAVGMNLSGLEMSMLACVSGHDRLSLSRKEGKGQGCRASNQRLAERVGCHYSRACSALSKLCELGLLEREPLGRHTVYRVIYNDDDAALFAGDYLPNGNTKVGAISAGVTPSCCELASQSGAICCQHTLETGGKAPETPSQYIPLNGGIHSVETGEYNSSEEARFATRLDEGGLRKSGSRGKESRQKAGLSKEKRVKAVGEKLAILQRALKDGAPIDRLAEYRWIGDEAFTGDLSEPMRQWAIRLSEEIVETMDDAELESWREEYGVAA